MTDEKDIIYFIAQIGHEIRTPLNAIKGFGDLLVEETFGPLNEQQKKYLLKMLTSSDKLLDIVNQILDWAKLESGQVILNVQKMEAYYLVKEVENLLEIPAKNKEITLTSEVPRALFIEGDPVRLREVLINLINNAIKFTEPRGQITVTVFEADEQVIFIIEDNGRGMDQAQLDKLFQPFNKGLERKGDEKSTGLGLWICQSIVALHHGKIWVKSKVNVGSTFYIALPKQQVHEAEGLLHG